MYRSTFYIKCTLVREIIHPKLGAQMMVYLFPTKFFSRMFLPLRLK